MASSANHTLDDPRIEAFGMLLEAHNELAAVVERNLDRRGHVPATWLGVLIRLARSPEDRMRMTALARDMTMSTSGLTRLIDRIEAAGHVRRETCPEDRRGFHVVLTDAGRDVLADATPVHLAVLERYLAETFTRSELGQLTDLLRRVRDHVRSVAAAESD